MSIAKSEKNKQIKFSPKIKRRTKQKPLNHQKKLGPKSVYR